MKISVLIPAYNCAGTIRTTLESVFNQTRPADEIIVVDDGSTDETAAIVRSLGCEINLISQANSGVASARNTLCHFAKGDLIAFLDSDDLWHPSYLETQSGLFHEYPHAVGFFTGHFTAKGNDTCEWRANASGDSYKIKTIEALAFLRLYNSAPGEFNMSWCCVPKRILNQMGDQPFQVSRGEDWYFFNLLTLYGDIVTYPAPLAAYRNQTGSLSSDPLKLSKAIVDAGRTLRPTFQAFPDKRFVSVFAEAIALKQRFYAKVLLTAGKVPEGRRHLAYAMKDSRNLKSILKSLTILFLSYLPTKIQPDWLSHAPHWKGPRY